MYTVCQKETKTTFSFLLFHLSCKCSAQAVRWVWKNYGHTILMTAGGKHRVWIQMTSAVRSTTYLQRVPVSITSEPLQQLLTGQWESTVFNLLKARPDKAWENILYGGGGGKYISALARAGMRSNAEELLHLWFLWFSATRSTNNRSEEQLRTLLWSNRPIV